MFYNEFTKVYPFPLYGNQLNKLSLILLIGNKPYYEHLAKKTRCFTVIIIIIITSNDDLKPSTVLSEQSSTGLIAID